MCVQAQVVPRACEGVVGLREFGLCLAETRLRLTPPLLGGIVLGMRTQQAVVGRRTFEFIARTFAQGGESLGGRRLGHECRGQFAQPEACAVGNTWPRAPMASIKRSRDNAVFSGVVSHRSAPMRWSVMKNHESVVERPAMARKPQPKVSVRTFPPLSRRPNSIHV